MAALFADCIEKRNNKYLTAAVDYIDKNYIDCSLSLQTVSENVGISSSYMSRLFSTAYGIGFNQYLNQLRCKAAKKLLKNESMTIQEIGEAVGFLSTQNFIRVFKKQTGYTPGSYRQII